VAVASAGAGGPVGALCAGVASSSIEAIANRMARLPSRGNHALRRHSWLSRRFEMHRSGGNSGKNESVTSSFLDKVTEPAYRP
jgi:hypothetical protein